MVYTVVGKGTFISSRDKIQLAKRSTDAKRKILSTAVLLEEPT